MRLRRHLRNRALHWSRRLAAPMRRWRGTRPAATLALDTIRRRLELGIAAMYGVQPRLVAAGSATGGDIILPPQLATHDEVDHAIARYRLLALAQAARCARGTNASAPTGDAIVHDLYLVAESAAAERDVVTRAPKLAPLLQALRFAELSARPKIFRLAHAERRVETLFRATLASPPDRSPDDVPVCATPAESRAWAEATAREIRRTAGDVTHYRPLNPMTMWGLAWPIRRSADEVELGGGAGGGRPDPYSAPQTDESGTRRGESESSDGGEQRAGNDAATDESDADGIATEGGATPMDRAQSAHDPERDTLDELRRGERRAADRPPPEGIPYPEWDDYGHRMREHGTTVSCSIADAGDATWADDVLREHAPVVREIRDRFAPLRARRTRLRRQRTGDELDLEAVVTALVDRRMGRVPSDQLYQVVRPARHTVAFALLVDASGSTATRLADGRTVLDVERMTLLLASEALASLGDPFAMLAFSGTGRHGVQVRTIKAFEEHDVAASRRRIAALVAEDNTRLGAAVRHATAVLRAQPAQRRVLLLLSDGQPNDVDFYQGAYAIEDSRRALNDARAGGVVPFCLTVEQEEHEYLPHVFGKTGYRVLRRPEQLPSALLEVVRGILGGA
ncbi:MAG: nitric oxide reductase activation protein NorD [Gemmatimonadaceae bacterium]